jgi:hypothetical protein
MSVTLDISLEQKLITAFLRAGYTIDDIEMLCKTPILLLGMREVLLGHAEVRTCKQIIDLDSDPVILGEFQVEEHQRGSFFEWQPKEVQLYLSELQLNEKSIKGNELRNELKGKPVLNANVLDYLLKYQNLIPEQWKKDEWGRTRSIYFWGTIYSDREGRLYVRCLFWLSGKWQEQYSCLDSGWYVNNPAAIR